MSSTYLKNWPFVSFHPSTLHSQIDLIWLNIRNFIFVKLPAASRGASLAQLELKLRRPLRYMSMMLDIFFNNFTSHAVSDRPRKISVLPQFPCPQLPLQHRERSEQLPRGYTFDDSHHFAYGISRWKG